MKLTGALATWLAIQILTLAAGAARLPLWARAGAQPQHLALAELLIVQFAASSLLFPSLMRGRNGPAIACAALPFVQLAAMLSATPVAVAVVISINMLLWLLGLGGLAQAVGSGRAASFVRLVLVLAVIGLPLIGYLSCEFADPLPLIETQLNPLNSAVRQSLQTTADAKSLIASTVFFVLSAAVFLGRPKKVAPAPSYPHRNTPTAH